MEKSDIGILSELLTKLKDASAELESAIRKNDSVRGKIVKRKIIELQAQINRKI